MLKGIWERLEQLQRLGEVADSLDIRRALAGALARPLPIGDGLRAQARLGIVVRYQLGLRLGSLREPCLQDLGDVLMVPLSGAPQ